MGPQRYIIVFKKPAAWAYHEPTEFNKAAAESDYQLVIFVCQLEGAQLPLDEF